MTVINWESLTDALVHVERLTASDSGLLSFGAPQAGGIFVERGRICWVAMRGLGKRLRDILLASCSVDVADLDRVSEECRAQGKPIGQTLVEESSNRRWPCGGYTQNFGRICAGPPTKVAKACSRRCAMRRVRWRR